MKKKLILLLLSTTLLLSACGSSTVSKDTAASETILETTVVENISEEPTTASSDSSSNIAALGDIEVDEGLFNVELTIPKDYVGETTQEELDQKAAENGFKSITLNEDGSATYVMTKKQHQELVGEIALSIDESMAEMIGSEDYPNITDITANDNYTSFTVTTKSTELSLNESFSILIYYMYGGMYSIFADEPTNNIHVDFVNADSGEIISSADSKNMNDDNTEK